MISRTLRLVSGLGAVAASLVFLTVASAAATGPPATVPMEPGTVTGVTFNGMTTPYLNIGVAAPGSTNTITATLTISDAGYYWYTSPIGFKGAETPFDSDYGCPVGTAGTTDTETESFTAPTVPGIYEIVEDLGPNFTCLQSWHPQGRVTIAVLVVPSDPLVAAGLTDKLVAAEGAVNRGNAKAAANIMKAFSNQVAAQTGKALTQDQADMLMLLVPMF